MSHESSIPSQISEFVATAAGDLLSRAEHDGGRPMVLQLTSARRADSVKSFSDCKSVRDFERLLRSAIGLSNRQAKKLAAVGWGVLSGAECAENDDDIASDFSEALNFRLEILRGE